METKERLKLILKETNTWWKDGSFKLEKYSFRQILAEIEKFLFLRQIVALVGLRRTGKSTLILKIIEIFLNKRIAANSILYFSFDDFSYLDIEDIIAAYKEIFSETDLKKGKFLFCFDEIQKLTDWQEKIKRLYDAYPNLKIIISGSESLFLRKKIRETLGGRIFEFKISSLNFKEYLYFTENENILKNTQLYKEEAIKLYKEFLMTNGFPELAAIKDIAIIHKYLKEAVIDKILFSDIPQLFKVKNTDILAELLDIIIFSPGQIIDIFSLSKELKLSRQAVSLYLDYLEKSFLVKKVYNFSRNLRKQKRALKKYYPAVIFPSMVEDNFPLVFENSLIWQLNAEFFYRDAYKNEVDMILVDKNKKILPVEVKTGKADLKPIEYVMRKYKATEAAVITLDKQAKQGSVKFIPFYKYLLAQS